VRDQIVTIAVDNPPHLWRSTSRRGDTSARTRDAHRTRATVKPRRSRSRHLGSSPLLGLDLRNAVEEVVMTNTLYVANVPFGTTEEALRRHFASCGGVADVELGSERGRHPRGLARVTMTSPAYAAAAVGALDRASFEGNVLRVSEAPIDAESSAPKVRIVQQFRERTNMTYDLDCAGVPLTIRVFAIEDGTWRLEARSTEAADAVVVTASAATRRDALDAVLRQWNDRAPSLTSIDNGGVLRAMSDVRAI
jgi:hypothetical protein